MVLSNYGTKFCLLATKDKPEILNTLPCTLAQFYTMVKLFPTRQTVESLKSLSFANKRCFFPERSLAHYL